MATISKTLSARKNENGESEVFLRIVNGRNTIIRYRSGIYVPADRFRDGEIKIPRFFDDVTAELKEKKESLTQLCLTIDRIVTNGATTAKEIKEALDGKTTDRKSNFFMLFEKYLESTKNYSEQRNKNFLSLERSLKRYEAVRNAEDNGKTYQLNVNRFDEEDITDYEDFLRAEHILCEQYKTIYEQFPLSTDVRRVMKVQPKGQTTINRKLTDLRAFFNWLLFVGETENRPFVRYKGKKDIQSDPIFLTREEREQLRTAEMPTKEMAEQRDVFIFQCLTGCRIGDLYRLRKSNVRGGIIRYVANKTKEDNGGKIEFPLPDEAKEILKRYRRDDTDGILPLISEQHYNMNIKKVAEFAGLTREVPRLNPTTGKPETVELCKVISSHTARRTFVGNLYNQVKDPNIIGKLSGHVEGSKAFARYRNIGKDIIDEVAKLI